jgi:AraC family transcriptional regulator
VALENIGATRNSCPVVRTAFTQNFGLSERQYGVNMISPVHAHAKNYIIITLDGSYLSTLETGTEEFTPWTVTYHQAGISHNSRYANRGARVLYIELCAERLKSFCVTPASHLRHFSLQGGLVEWAARQLYQEFISSDQFSGMAIDGLVMQLLAHLMRHYSTRPQRLPVWLGRANEIIRNRFMERLVVSDIASSVHVHPGHLAREYMRHYNCTIGEHIRRLRVEYACEHLSSTDRSLADIALSAGFSDQSHFSVSFKQQIGMTPSDYRKSLKGMLCTQ